MARKTLFDRRAVLDAAFFIFKHRGTEHFTIRNIAKVLNSSTTPIYANFKNMEEIEDALVQEIVDFIVEPIINLDDYYTYENLSIAICLFAKRHRKLFEVIFLKSEGHVKNRIKMKLFQALRKIMLQDKNFDYERDYWKLIQCDGVALNIFNWSKDMSEDEIREIVKKYLFDTMENRVKEN